jgi:ectoine hydroxylase-related dioxygenase (phytanoyl-CoA dioxygenase family)
VDELRGIYDRLFEQPAEVLGDDRLELAGDPDETPKLPQIVNPDRYAPELLETIARRNAEAIARQLLGPDVRPMGMHAIRKPPREGAETPWHQDEAYWDPGYRHEAVSVWVPLQPATVENGCMQFVPGSHLLEVRPHRLINADAHGLVLDEPLPVDQAVPCPIPPGGATIHTGRTLHYAGPNLTDEPRRALIMAFARPAEKLATPRDYHWQRPEWAGSS